MNYKTLLMVGVFFMVTNTLCIAYLFTLKNENTQFVTASKAENRIVLSKGEKTANGFTSLENKMEHLVQGVLFASAEITALKTEIKKIKDNANSRSQNKDNIPQLTQAEIQQNRVEAKQLYLSNLQSSPRNEAWASQMEDEMLSSIENAQLYGFAQSEVNVLSVECYTDNCLIDITLSDSNNESMVLAMLPWEVSAEFIPSEHDALAGRMVVTKL